jgi:hypothetical protein
MRARWTGRRAGIALVVALTSLGCCAVLSAAAGQTFKLTGKVKGDSGSQVSLKVGNGNRSGTFRAESFLIPCEDNSFPRISLPPIRVRFGRQGRFEGTWFEQTDGVQQFARVQGELRGRRVAEGVVYYFKDVDDPPPAAPALDCATTTNSAEWIAERN